ncbi:MAG: small subunit ribosomal protein ispH, lytB [Variibacter sp.]|nr:small subunit ribosomal protein ispH, lytB [Variibacter sp.]
MEILTDKAGFCLGIARAYRKMNERALDEGAFNVTHQNAGGDFDTLTRIARREKELLADYPGLGKLAVVRDVSTLGEGDRLVLGFHGLNKDTKQHLAARGVELVEDLTCPFIAKLDKMVERLARDGFDIAIVGTTDNHHCRVAKQIADEHGRRCFVIEQPGDIDAVPAEVGRPVALVGQVTGNTQVFTEVLQRIRSSGSPIKVVKTMCSDSYGRQRAASDLAKQADLVILLDDGGGAAQSLFEVCTRTNKRVHRVRSKEEIQPHWFDGAQSTAIVGGILVPSWVIAETVRYIETMTG